VILESCDFDSAEISVKLPKNSGYKNLIFDDNCPNIDVNFKKGKSSKLEVKVETSSDTKFKLGVLLVATNSKSSIEKLCKGKKHGKTSCKIDLKKLK